MTRALQVSVVVPAYQAATTISACIESALTQSVTSLECLVVDDGSTDGTADIVRAVATGDSRVVLLSQPNAGPASARNLALRQARGEWVAFLDADDRWLPDKLERELFEAGGSDVVYSDAYLVVGGVRTGTYSSAWPPPPLEADMFAHLLSAPNPVPLLSVLVRRPSLVQAGGFRADWHGVEDLDLWLRLAQSCSSFGYVDEVTCEYVVRPESISGNRAAHLAEEWRLFQHWTACLRGTRYGHLARQRARDVGLAAIRARRSPEARWRDRAVDLAAILTVTRRPRPVLSQTAYVLAPRLLAKMAPAAIGEPHRGRWT